MNVSMCIYSRDQRLFGIGLGRVFSRVSFGSKLGGNLAVSLVGPVVSSMVGGNLAVFLVGPAVWFNAWWKPCRVSGWATGLIQTWWKPPHGSGSK